MLHELAYVFYLTQPQCMRAAQYPVLYHACAAHRRIRYRPAPGLLARRWVPHARRAPRRPRRAPLARRTPRACRGAGAAAAAHAARHVPPRRRGAGPALAARVGSRGTFYGSYRRRYVVFAMQRRVPRRRRPRSTRCAPRPTPPKTARSSCTTATRTRRPIHAHHRAPATTPSSCDSAEVTGRRCAEAPYRHDCDCSPFFAPFAAHCCARCAARCTGAHDARA